MSDATFENTVDDVGQALDAFVAGDPAAYKSRWAARDDVTIFGAWGAYEVGWEEVGPRLDWAGARFAEGGGTHQEILAAGSSGDLGYTVSLERGEARVAGRDEPAPMLLRVTHLYRRVDGEWRIVHRHADAIVDKIAADAVLQRR
jgi:ketosteroid isomerase-like protein